MIFGPRPCFPGWRCCRSGRHCWCLSRRWTSLQCQLPCRQLMGNWSWKVGHPKSWVFRSPCAKGWDSFTNMFGDPQTTIRLVDYAATTKPGQFTSLTPPAGVQVANWSHFSCHHAGDVLICLDPIRFGASMAPKNVCSWMLKCVSKKGTSLVLGAPILWRIYDLISSNALQKEWSMFSWMQLVSRLPCGTAGRILDLASQRTAGRRTGWFCASAMAYNETVVFTWGSTKKRTWYLSCTGGVGSNYIYIWMFSGLILHYGLCIVTCASLQNWHEIWECRK